MGGDSGKDVPGEYGGKGRRRMQALGWKERREKWKDFFRVCSV